MINKPLGCTSHDMVSFVRRISGIRKVGHTGTLDPAATGVLPICIGKATKAAELLTAADKAYRAELVLGMTTDTLDADGEVLTDQPACVTEQKINEAIQKYIGEIDQIPPMYSAIKKDGKKLCDLARAGVTIEREPRRVRISEIRLLHFNEKQQTAEIEVFCSKGTYIRTLCDDLGKTLGCGAYMNRLVRTKSGQFTLSESYTREELVKASENGTLSELLTSVDELFDFPKVILPKELSERVKNGVRVQRKGLLEEQRYRVYDEEYNFLSVSVCREERLVLEKAFWV